MPWRADDPSLPQPRYPVGYWEREDAFERGPGWSDLTEAVSWGRARAPMVRVALARTMRERRALSLGREPVEGPEILVEESSRVAAEIPWPDTLVEGFGGEVAIHEASGGWDPTGEYGVSAVELEQQLTHPEDLNDLHSEPVSGSPFTSLADAVGRATAEFPVVIVQHGPYGGYFHSAEYEEPEGLPLPRLPESWL